MKPTRRGFLGTLGGLSTLGLVRSSDATATPSSIPQGVRLDAFNASVASTETIGAFRLRFTGLKGSSDDDDLAGQWIAHGNVRGHTYRFVGVVPCVDEWACHPYDLGAVFPVRRGISAGRLESHPDGVRNEIWLARIALIDGLRALGMIPHARPL